jgi:murein DD-endopeptidase MepM/ murein hydrolase activator NlpD
MALKSIVGGWILVGAVAGAFFYLPTVLGSKTVTDAVSTDDPSTEQPDPPIEGPLEIELPDIELTEDPPAPETELPFPDTLSVCGLMSVSHAPDTNEVLEITAYQPFVSVNGIDIAMAPIETGCFSSGFGLRGERVHKGVDFHNRAAVEIYAAADGIVREKEYRDDYGNMIVIEHGSGVFTRYAHLESFGVGIAIGNELSAGEPLGTMGNTASYRIPRHLHYEVLVGEWTQPAGSFALTPFNLFASLSEN